MGRFSKVKLIAYAKGWLRPAATSASEVEGKPKSVKSKRGPIFGYNPSIGKLRAWADPVKGINGTITGEPCKPYPFVVTA